MLGAENGVDSGESEDVDRDPSQPGGPSTKGLADSRFPVTIAVKLEFPAV